MKAESSRFVGYREKTMNRVRCVDSYRPSHAIAAYVRERSDVGSAARKKTVFAQGISSARIDGF